MGSHRQKLFDAMEIGDIDAIKRIVGNPPSIYHRCIINRYECYNIFDMVMLSKNIRSIIFILDNYSARYGAVDIYGSFAYQTSMIRLFISKGLWKIINKYSCNRQYTRLSIVYGMSYSNVMDFYDAPYNRPINYEYFSTFRPEI
jgi:hypothetical protein